MAVTAGMELHYWERDWYHPTTDSSPFFGVSWGELTSSQLIAPSYGAAAKCETTTDH